MLNTHPIPALSDNYIWALANDEREVLVVDPGDATVVINYLTETSLKLTGILITHKHWDHTNGINGILNIVDVPVYGPLHDRVPSVTHKLDEGDSVVLSGFPSLKILAIPG